MSVEHLEESLKNLTWQSIHQHPTKSKEEIALEFFELASLKEVVGSLSEAANYYRRAFKLDEKVDLKYRENLVRNQPAPEVRKDGSLLDKFKRLDLSNIKVKPLIESFRHEEFHSSDQDKPVLLDKLPDEIITYIMEILVHQDTPSWFNFSMTSKRLSYLGFGQAACWKTLCELIYPIQKYDVATMNEVGGSQWQNVEKYNKDWHKMLHDRPFIKYNGLYISVVNYQREGGRAEMSNSWNLPFRIITYYRYIRFFRDGSFLRLMTVLEPSQVVPKFVKNWREHFGKSDWEKVYEGQWRMDDKGLVTCESNGPVNHYRFVDKLRVVNAGKYARHHKLDWKEKGFVNTTTGDYGDLSFNNERSFAFSRVRSYGREGEATEEVQEVEDSR